MSASCQVIHVMDNVKAALEKTESFSANCSCIDDGTNALVQKNLTSFWREKSSRWSKFFTEQKKILHYNLQNLKHFSNVRWIFILHVPGKVKLSYSFEQDLRQSLHQPTFEKCTEFLRKTQGIVFYGTFSNGSFPAHLEAKFFIQMFKECFAKVYILNPDCIVCSNNKDFANAITENFTRVFLYNRKIYARINSP